MYNQLVSKSQEKINSMKDVLKDKDYAALFIALLDMLGEKNPAIKSKVRGIAKYTDINHETLYSYLRETPLEDFEKYFDKEDIDLILKLFEAIVSKAKLKLESNHPPDKNTNDK